MNSLDFPLDTEFYYDLDLTSPAGTFDIASNSFNFNEEQLASLVQLYFHVDGSSTCESVGTVPVSVSPESSCNVCYQSIVLTDDTVGEQNASNAIATDGEVRILNGVSTTLKAGTFILLRSGFEVKAGANFNAVIEQCTPSNNTQ